MQVPRVADHDQRRALIARSFQQHVAAHGLTPTTFAKVAAVAGISVGLIQHYFDSKDDLLRFAYVESLRERDDRIARHIEQGEAAERSIRDILGVAIRELLPLDEQRNREWHVGQHLLAQALHVTEISEVAAQADHDLHLRVVVAVRNGTVCGEVEVSVDAEVAASRILSTAYGLASRLALTGELPAPAVPDPVEPVLGPVLDAVFTGRCHHYAAGN